jgi:hypothetical protein
MDPATAKSLHGNPTAHQFEQYWVYEEELKDTTPLQPCYFRNL